VVDSSTRLAREVFLIGFFGGSAPTDGWTTDRLTTMLSESRVRAGDALFREGEPAERIYFVESGSVRSSRAGEPSWRYEGRWLLGTTDVLLDRLCTRTALALRDLDIVSLAADDWLEIFDDSAAMARVALSNASAATSTLYTTQPSVFSGENGTPSLRPTAPLSWIETLLAFFEAPALHRAGVQLLAELTDVAREIRLEPGAILAEMGGPRDDIYLVAHGAIACSFPGRSSEARFRRGHLVGAAAFLGAPARTWEAHATEPASVLAVPVEAWQDVMEEHVKLARLALGFVLTERERIFGALATGGEELVLR
jgi:CRP-like cAMP-binding protein